MEQDEEKDDHSRQETEAHLSAQCTIYGPGPPVAVPVVAVCERSAERRRLNAWRRVVFTSSTWRRPATPTTPSTVCKGSLLPLVSLNEERSLCSERTVNFIPVNGQTTLSSMWMVVVHH